MYDVGSAPNINRIWTSLIVDLLAKREVLNYFTSPGLRNAPILAAINSHPEALAKSGIDERSMAYRALGHAKATGKPGVLVCTSGTAMANYLPAIIEASQTNTPLLVLTADRPKRLVDEGDNQAIVQPKLFGDYVRKEICLELPSLYKKPQELVDQLTRFLDGNYVSGPLHINMPLDEPLDLTEDSTPKDYRKLASEVRLGDLIENHELNFNLPKLDPSKKTLLVVGPTPEYESKDAIKLLISKCQLPCLLDIGSGLKFSDIESNRVLPSFEHPEIKILLEKEKLQVIIHLGGRLVSKHYYNFLKTNPDIDVLLVGNQGHYTHPAQNPTWEVKVSLNSFCTKAIEESYLTNQTPYMFDCKSIIGQKEDIIEHSSLSFPVISKRLVEMLPDESSLYLGNSTTIRSFDAYASTTTQAKRINVLSHRGASGIEGFNASALGYAESSEKTTVLVHGDIGFMHDLSSLLMYKNIKLPLINIVVNNHGGGIFKHLPIANDSETLPLITTEHNLEFDGLCQWLGIDYQRVENISQFESAFGSSLSKQSICIIEAVIDQNENMAVYERLKTLKL